tara:strand:+ start:27 stop:290 length:264 start_codon:yes stop_codon:yes gene_type:complete
MMIARSELIRRHPTGVSSNGNAAVMVVELVGVPCVYTYAPRSVGGWDRRDEFNSLVDEAMRKIGWTRDRRCSIGWRKAPSIRRVTQG